MGLWYAGSIVFYGFEIHNATEDDAQCVTYNCDYLTEGDGSINTLPQCAGINMIPDPASCNKDSNQTPANKVQPVVDVPEAAVIADDNEELPSGESNWEIINHNNLEAMAWGMEGTH